MAKGMAALTAASALRLEKVLAMAKGLAGLTAASALRLEEVLAMGKGLAGLTAASALRLEGVLAMGKGLAGLTAASALRLEGVVGVAAVALVWGFFCGVGQAGFLNYDSKPIGVVAWADEVLAQDRVRLAEAAQLFRDGKLDACKVQLTSLKITHPAIPDPELILIWFQLSQRELTLAKARLEKLAASRPRDPQVILTLGQVAIAEGRLADAGSHLEKAAQLPMPTDWPTNQSKQFATTVFEALTFAYEQQARWPDVKVACSALVELENENASYLLRLARALYLVDDRDALTALLQKIAQLKNGTIPREVLLADLAFSAGRHEEAEVNIQQALKKYPQNPAVHVWAGQWWLSRDSIEQAGRELDKAYELGLTSSHYWIPKGQQHMCQGKYGSAVAAFRYALEALDDEQQVHQKPAVSALLALSLLCTGGKQDQREAIEIAERNALEHATDAQQVAILGWGYLQAHRVDSGKALLTRVTEMTENLTSDMSFFMADLNFEIGFYDVSRKFNQAALDGSAGLFLMRSRAEALAKKLDEL